jgi:hypothetical protein
MTLRRRSLLALVLAAALAGCGDEEPTSPVAQFQTTTTQATTEEAPPAQEEDAPAEEAPPDDDAPAPQDDEPGVEILAPASGARVGNPVRVRFRVRGRELATRQTFFEDPQLAHVHLLLDDGKLDGPSHSPSPPELAEKDGAAGRYSPVVSTEVAYRDIPPGEHTLVVELLANDHAEEGGRQSASVTFRVTG